MEMSTAKLKKDVVKLLVGNPMTLKELATSMGLKEKKVFNLLKGLFSSGEITSMKIADGQRKYRPTTAEEKAIQEKAAAVKAEAEESDDEDIEDDEEDE